MEYLPDGSVEGKHRGMPVPVGEAVRIMVDACRGIEHLHVRGSLHRDIKPDNLLTTPTNTIDHAYERCEGKRFRAVLFDSERYKRTADRL